MERDIRELIRPELVAIDVQAADKWQALERLVDHAVQARAIPLARRALVLEAVLGRERCASTGLEAGLAMPHGFTSAVDWTLVVLGRLSTGVDFEGFDGEPARLLILLIAPDDAPSRERHLRLIGGFAQALASAEVRAELLSAEGAEAFAARIRAAMGQSGP